MRDRNRILLATAAALVAGALAYANPARSLEHRVARNEKAAKKDIRALFADCPIDWDQAPVARAMLSISQ
ncbi:hypothetical protein LZK98_10235 [Sphingomonas cannabina]|uniref:hypothetical protein n=1 Tax=Sphingomonas cannabina TaxID=2899123 RepID=UPI001F1ADC4E|nr:hypothetical protein [Sphingomonas cannabina]UIJ47283.1 hypothetical protein LZK98_10235 [Sphingomonas cannabina]